VFTGEGGSSPACREEDDGDGEGRRGSRARRRGAEKTPAALLLHFPASLVQRRPNAVAPPASSSSPAELATSNGRELGEEKMSARLLELG
jgi:hypothetical protein